MRWHTTVWSVITCLALGTTAARATGDERAQQLAEVRRLIATQHPTDALELLDSEFPGDHTAEVTEERALAHEALAAVCATTACRLREVVAANGAHTTPDRTSAVDQARTQVLDALDPAHVDAKPALPRLQQLHRLHDEATAAAKIPLDDAALQARAGDAISFAETERAKIPLLGNNLAVAEDLLGASTKSNAGLISIALDRDAVYLTIDRAGRCTGVYAAGDATAQHHFSSTTWPAVRLLSQIVGKPSTVPAHTAGAVVSRGTAGGAAVVARWADDTLIELRIGDATP
jgi:hypothetical protein